VRVTCQFLLLSQSGVVGKVVSQFTTTVHRFCPVQEKCPTTRKTCVFRLIRVLEAILAVQLGEKPYFAVQNLFDTDRILLGMPRRKFLQSTPPLRTNPIVIQRPQIPPEVLHPLAQSLRGTGRADNLLGRLARA
jgi:hypothetical protein